MARSYDLPLDSNPNGPLYRVDKAIIAAQKRLDYAIGEKRFHTNQKRAHEVIKDARGVLKNVEKLRLAKIAELAASAKETEKV